jgi:hypothetical protein
MSFQIVVRKKLETNAVQIASALTIYLSLSIYYFGIPIIFHPSQLYVGVGGADPTTFMWCLVWWPHALLNHSNPFISHAIWAPSGYNLAWATSIPGLSLLAHPITHRFGPVVSYNVLCLLAPTSAAWGAFLLCRSIVRKFWPTLLGGYVFGFSPYILGHMRGHLCLVMVFPIPIIVLLVFLELNRTISRRRAIIALTLILTFEFLTSTETFATATIVGAFVIASALLTFPVDGRRAIWSSLLPLACAYAATVLLLTPYLYYVFARGEPPPINPAQTYSADLLNFLLPTKVTLIGHNQFAAVTARFTGNLSENTSYLGIPLLAVVLLFAVCYWSKPSVKLLIFALLFVCLASLGPALHVAGERTITLPWAIASHLPLIDQALPGRLSLYSFLIAGLITALYLGDPTRRGSTRLIVASLILLFSLPNLSYFRMQNISKADTPAFFSTNMYRKYLDRDNTILIIPFAYLGKSMLWQAQTGMYFTMVEGHVGGEAPPEFTVWPVVHDLLTGTIGDGFSEQLRAFLGAHQVKAVIVDQRYRHAWSQLSATLGVAPLAIGDVLLYRVSRNILLSYRNADPTVWRQTRAFVRFLGLISAAERYVSAGLPLSRLTPWEAERQRLLAPRSPNEMSQGNANSNWQDDLWLGSYGEGIGVGIMSSYITVKPLIEKFGPYAAEVYFPYPNKITANLESGTYGQLLMVFEPKELGRATGSARTIPHYPSSEEATAPLSK